MSETRHTVDTITPEALEQLYAERDGLRATAQQYLDNALSALDEASWRAFTLEAQVDHHKRAHASTVVEARRQAARAEKAERVANLLADAHRRAEQAEAANARVRALLDQDQDGLCCSRLVGQVRAALAEPPARVDSLAFTTALSAATQAVQNFRSGTEQVRAALDEPKAPHTNAANPIHPNARHRGGNAEDCQACCGTNPLYPFLCPGPPSEAER